MSDWLCRVCGCAEEEHGADDGICTGCGEECDFEEPDDADYDEEEE